MRFFGGSCDPRELLEFRFARIDSQENPYFLRGPTVIRANGDQPRHSQFSAMHSQNYLSKECSKGRVKGAIRTTWLERGKGVTERGGTVLRSSHHFLDHFD